MCSDRRWLWRFLLKIPTATVSCGIQYSQLSLWWRPYGGCGCIVQHKWIGLVVQGQYMKDVVTETWENCFLSIGFLLRVSEDQTRIDKAIDFCRLLSPLRLRKYTLKLGPSQLGQLTLSNGSREMECESRMVSWWKEQWTWNSEWSKYTFLQHETAWCPGKDAGHRLNGKGLSPSVSTYKCKIWGKFLSTFSLLI